MNPTKFSDIKMDGCISVCSEILNVAIPAVFGLKCVLRLIAQLRAETMDCLFVL